MSGGGAGRAGGMPKSPMAARDFQQLADYMQSKHGIALDPSVQRLDFEAVRSGLDGVDAVLDEFPQMAGTIGTITYDGKTNGYAYAQWGMSPDGIHTVKIAMSRTFGDSAAMADQLNRDGSFHPANTDIRAVMAHETGHALETALTRKNYADRWDQYGARSKRKEATRIIGAAARDVKKLPEGKLPNGKGKPIGDIVAEVSRYATTNRSEAFAECIGDYIANGSKAHPLSQAVWRRVKAEMG